MAENEAPRLKSKEEVELQSAKEAIRRAFLIVGSDNFQDMHPEAASVRLEAIKLHWMKFQTAYEKLVETLEEEEKRKMLEIMVTSEEEYFTASAAYLRKAKEMSESNRDLRQVLQLKLPFKQGDVTNTWGLFDGNYKKWPGFKDRFIAAVHNNPDITNAYKFQHLVKSLVGKAERALGEWQLTEDNYQAAWERLLEMYDKKYLICQDLLKTFLRLPLLEYPTANGLQRMSNTTHETLRQLKAQGVPVEYWDVMVVHMLHLKLDAETAKAWELQRKEEMPAASEMLKFLDQQAAALSSNMRHGVKAEQNGKDSNVLTNNVKGSSGNRPQKIKNKLPCSKCHSTAHPVWECPDFLQAPLTRRREIMIERRLCQNSLKEGHKADNCYQGPCARCKGVKHNSLLCPIGNRIEKGKDALKRKYEDQGAYPKL